MLDSRTKAGVTRSLPTKLFLKGQFACAKKVVAATVAHFYMSSSIKKNCHECGMPLSVGIANCSHCGATVGTLFSEEPSQPVQKKVKRQSGVGDRISYHERVEKAQERANNSLILALASFFCPGIGFFMGVAAIVMSVLAARTLRADNVEDGQGSATAGLIIGVLGLIAQGGYVMYVIKSGKLPFVG